MKNDSTLAKILSPILGAAMLLAFLSPLQSASAAAVPAVLSYQGRLANSSGNLLGGSSGGTYYFKFSIWDASSNGNKLWPLSNPTAVAVTVREGAFSVGIGDTANGYPDALDYAFDRADVFLKVEVSSDNATFETLAPRQRISSAAFAQMAGSVVSASSTVTNLTSANATTTNATSTNLYVSGIASTTNLFASILNAGSSMLASLLVSGSSTLQNFTAQNSTSSNATTTNLYVAGNASTTNLFTNVLRAGAGTFTNLLSSSLTVSSLAGSGTRCLQTDNNGLISFAAGACGTGGSGSGGAGTWSTTTSQTAGQFVNYSGNTTDIVAVGGFATTSAPIYFDPNLSFAKIFNQSFSLSSTTLQNFTAQNGTTTSFAASVLAATGLSNTLVKANAAGQLVAAVPGTDYQAPGSYLSAMTFAYPFRSLAGGEQATSSTLVFGNGFVSSASSTLANFTFQNATGTSATTTNFAVTTLCIGAECRTSFPAASTFSFPFRTLGTGENATNTTVAFTSGFLSTASSTLASTTVTSLLANNATATDLYVSNLASTSQIRSNTGIIGFLTSVFHTATNLLVNGSSTLQNFSGQTGTLGNLAVNGSSTLQNFTAQNSTTTNATTTTLFVSNLASTSQLRTNTAQTGSLTAGNITATGSSTLQNFTAQNSTSSNMYVSGIASTAELRANTGLIGYINSALGVFSNILALGSSTFQNLTFQNATGTQATTTNFAVTSVTSSLLKAGSLGSLVSAISGTDYQAPITGSYPVLFNNNVISLAFGTTTNNAWGGQQTFLSSSTLQNFTFQNATGTAATTTGLAITGVTGALLKTNANGSVIAAVPGTDYLATMPFSFPFRTLGTGENSTNTTLALNNGFVSNASSTINSTLLVTGSTTLQGFTFQNATGTSATTTTFAATNLTALGSTTLQNFTAQESTTTNATSTNFYALNISAPAANIDTVKTGAIKTSVSGSAGLTIGSTGTPQLLSFDTIRDRVQTGVGAGSASPVLFVFDTKNTSGDPAGVNGAMYYNSNSNTFRCYQDSQWQNCGNQSTSTTLYVSQQASTTDLRANTATVGYLTAGEIASGAINGQNISASANFTGSLSALSGLTSLANLFVNGSSTFQDFTAQGATTTNLFVSGLASTSELRANTASTGNLLTYALTVGGLAGSGTRCLQIDNNGTVSAAASACGSAGGSGGGSWATTTSLVANQFLNYSLNNSDIITIGSNATGSAKFFFDPNALFAKIGGELLVTSSTTLQNVTAQNSTTTNATTTSLATNTLCLSGDCRTLWPTTGSSFAFPFKTLGTGENATNTTVAFTSGFLSTASSTLASTTVTSLLANNATATDLYVSNLASTTSLRANTGIISFLTSVFNTATNLLITGSSTLQNFTAQNSTTTNATTTSLATNTLCIGGDCRTAFPAASTFAWPFTKQGDNFQATSTGMLLSGGFVSSGSSTLTTLTFTNATGTSLSATTLAASGLSNTLVKANAVGQLVPAAAGTDYQATVSATFPILFNSNVISLGFGTTTNNFWSGAQTFTNSSTTLQNFTAQNATTTSLSASVLAATGLSNTLVKANAIGQLVAATAGTDYLASMTFAFPWTKLGTNELSTSTTLVFGNGFVSSASSTLQNFTFQNATGTSATTTNLATTNFCLNGDCRTSFPAASTFSFPFRTLGTGEQSTSTTLNLAGGILTSASSTLGSTTVSTLLANTATTTILYASNTITAGVQIAAPTIGGTTVAGVNGAFTSSLINLGSTTLQNFTAQNSTTTNATTTSLATNTLCIGGDCRTAFPAASTFVFPYKTLSGLSVNSTNTTMAFYGGILSNASSTLASTTVTTLLANAASTTNLAVTSLTAGSLVKAAPGGSGALISATAGTDYLASMSFAWPFTKLGTNEQATTTVMSFQGGLLSLASSTLASTTVSTLLSTNATATNMAVTSIAAGSLVKTLPGGSGALGAAIAGTDYIAPAALFNFGRASTTEFSAGMAFFGRTGTTTINGAGDLYVNGSTTLQSVYANSATATRLYATNLLVLGSSTLQDFTAQFATTTGLSVKSSALNAFVVGPNGPNDPAFQVDASTGSLSAGVKITGSTGGAPVTISANSSLPNVGLSLAAKGTGHVFVNSPLIVSSLGLVSSGSTTLTSSVTVLGSTTLQNFSGQTGTLGNLAVNGSSTLQNFTASNSTTTNATTTSLATNTLCIGGDCRTAFPAASTFAYPFRTLGTGEQSTSTTMNFTGGLLTSASSTLASTTVSTLLATNATATNIHATNMVSTGGTFRSVRNDPNALFELAPQGGTGAHEWWVGATRSGSGIANPGSFFIWDESSSSPRFVIDAIGDVHISNKLNVTGQLTASGGVVVPGILEVGAVAQNLSVIGGEGSTYNFTYVGSGEVAGGVLNGFAITPSNDGAPSSGVNVLNAIYFDEGIGGNDADNETNGINFASATGYKTFFTSPNVIIGSSGSTTLQNFTAQNATTSSLASDTICLAGDCRTSWPTGSGGSFAFPFLTLGTGEQSTSTTVRFGSGILSTASSTLASTTVTSLLANNATATDLYVSNLASTTNLRSNTGIIGFLTSVFHTATNLLVNGSSTLQNFTGKDYLGLGSTTLQSVYANSATATNLSAGNILATGSSTFQLLSAKNLLAFGSTTLQNATTSDLYVSGLASTTNLRANVANIGQLNVTSCVGCSGTFAWPFTKLGTNEQATTTVMSFQGGILSLGSSTFSNILALGSSTFQALFSSSATATNLYSTNFLASGSSTLQNFTGKDYLSLGSTTLQSVYANSATATRLYATNFLGLGSTTLQNATASSLYVSGQISGDYINVNNAFFGAVTTGLTDTILLKIQGVPSSLLKTESDGSVGAAVAGTDYLASMTFKWPFTKLGTNEQATTTVMSFQGGFLSGASSTLQSTLLVLGSTTLQSVYANSATATNLSAGNILATGSSTFQLLSAKNLLAFGSTTLQNATTSDLYVSGLASTTNLRANVANIGNLTVTSCTGCGSGGSSFAFPFKTLGTGEQSTSTTMNFTAGIITSASSTLASTTATSLLAANATATDLFVSRFMNVSEFGGYRQGGALLGYGSSTNQVSVFGIEAGGNSATTTASPIGSTAIGYKSLAGNLSGFGNTAVGTKAMEVNNSGSYNAVVGGDALRKNFTGSSNVAIGFGALEYNESATTTVAIGMNAGNGFISHSNQGNVYLGYAAGVYGLNNANYNTYLGYQAGNLSSGAYNIVLGQNVDNPSTSGSRQLNIGNVLYGMNIYNGAGVSSQPVASGRIGIGSSTPSAALSIHANIGGSYSSLFAIASSSAGATTTLFNVNNAGLVNMLTATATDIKANTATIGNLTVTSCTGCGSGAMSFSWPWTKLSTNEQATSTSLVFLNGLMSTASSTLASTTASNLLVTGSATSSNLYAGNLLLNGSSTFQNTYISNLTVGSCTGCGGGPAGGNSKWASSTVANSNGIYPNGGNWVDVLIGATATTSKARLEVIAAAGNGGALHAFGSTTINTLTISALSNGQSQVAVGSTSPMALFTIHASSTPTTASRQFIFAIGSTSPSKTTTTLFGIDGNGRVYASSTRPTVSSCGGGTPSIVGTDVMGRVTVGTAAAACLVTFTRSWGNAPFCVVTNAGYASGGKVFLALNGTTTATTLNVMAIATTAGATTISPRMDSLRFTYYCQGNIE